MTKLSILCVLCCGALVMLSSCSNTLNGAGRDIEKVGQKVQQTF